MIQKRFPKKVNFSNKYAQKEHKNVNEEPIIQLTKQKLACVINNLHIYEQEQKSRTPASIKLLTFVKDQTCLPQNYTSKQLITNNEQVKLNNFSYLTKKYDKAQVPQYQTNFSLDKSRQSYLEEYKQDFQNYGNNQDQQIEMMNQDSFQNSNTQKGSSEESPWQSYQKVNEQNISDQNLHIYQSEQESRTPPSIKLLTFEKDNTYQAPNQKSQEIITSNEQVKLNNFSYLNKKYGIAQGLQYQTNISLKKNSEKHEKEIEIYGKNQDQQVETTYKESLYNSHTNRGYSEEVHEQKSFHFDSQMEKIYKDAVFNLRNEESLLVNSSLKINQRDEYTEWFTQVEKIITNQENYKQEINYDPMQFQQHVSQSFSRGMSKIMKINTDISRIEDYHKFDEYFSTSIQNFNTPVYLTVIVNLNSFLSLLTVIKALLLIKSYSTLNIQFRGIYKHEINSDEFKLVENLVETIFRIIFSQRSLQLIDFSIDQRFTSSIAKGIGQTDLENSNIRVFKCSSGPNGKSEHLSDFFYQISKLKQLYHFQISEVLINQNNVENFSTIFKNVRSADLKIIRTQIKFDCPYLEKLKVSYKFYSSTEVKINYDNFQKAVNLDLLQIYHNTIPPNGPRYQQPFYGGRFSRKQILHKQKIKQVRQVQANKKLRQQKIQSKESETTDQGEMWEEEFVNGLDEMPYTLNSLLNLKNLQNLSIILLYDQSVINSFISLLKNSPQIRIIHATFKTYDPETENVEENLDFREVLPSINYLKNIESFYFKFQLGHIQLQKETLTSKFTYTLNCCQQNQEDKIKFYPFQFSFIHNVTSITYTIKEIEDAFLEKLDQICQSVSHMKNIELFELDMACTVKFYQQLERNKVNNPYLYLFGHLGDLTNLETLNVLLPLNQNIIDSIASMFEQQYSLKNFKISRQKVKQYYLDFTKLFKAVTYSCSIEQITLHLGIEDMNIIVESHHKIWEEAKLKYFYLQLCKMIKYSQNLFQLNFNEQFNEIGRVLILKSLLSRDETKKILFYDSTEYNSSNCYSYSNEYIQLKEQLQSRRILHINPLHHSHKDYNYFSKPSFLRQQEYKERFLPKYNFRFEAKI